MNKLKRIRKCLSIIRQWSSLVNQDSYYPECEHKSHFRILMDQLYNVWRFGYIEEYYFTYGFDRKAFTREKMGEYITPYRVFLHRVDYLNFHNPYCKGINSKVTCRLINQDKFFFFLFLSRLSFPTPKVYCFIKNKKVLYSDSSFTIDNSVSTKEQLRTIFANDIDAFAKPSDGMLGKGVFKLRVKDGLAYIDDIQTNIENVIERVLSADYIIQERVVQHKEMDALCPSSVNTIRLQTVMDQEGNVIPFGPGVRIGRVGNNVDNWAKGGIFVGIDSASETLKEVGIMKPQYGTKVTEHPDTHILFDGYHIPYYKEAEELAIQLHKLMYRNHSIGWDIAISENGPIFLEGNDRWEITLIQAVHGGLNYLMKYFN